MNTMRKLEKYKNINLPSLDDKKLKELDALRRMDDKDIDLSDAPEASDSQLKSGHFYYADSLKMPKTGIHLMIDQDNLDWLKQSDKVYQPRLNKILRWARLNNCPIEKL